MSSFELLELFGVRFEDDAENRVRTIYADHAPELGAVARAMRNGHWSEMELIIAETFNELARLRSSYHAGVGGKRAAYEPFQFEDPAVRVEKAKQAVAQAKLQSEVEEDIFGGEG